MFIDACHFRIRNIARIIYEFATAAPLEDVDAVVRSPSTSCRVTSASRVSSSSRDSNRRLSSAVACLKDKDTEMQTNHYAQKQLSSTTPTNIIEHDATYERFVDDGIHSCFQVAVKVSKVSDKLQSCSVS